jgi:hypothetical protein
MTTTLVLLHLERRDSYASLRQSLSGHTPRRTRREQIRSAWRPVTSYGGLRINRNRVLAKPDPGKNTIQTP